MLAEQMVPAVIARLGERVDFGGRIDTAADFAALLRSGQIQPVLRAFVLPSALIGGAATALSGVFVQNVERGLSVMITLPALDGTGVAGGNRLEQLVLDTIAALAGWGPDDTPGVFALQHGRLLSVKDGAMIYQIDFSVLDQLRISP